MNRKKWNNCKFEWCCLGILIALELIMSSTFLGYIHVPPISVATAYIPVVVIGCLFGTAQSAFAGLIFGFGSMYKASALYVMADDRLFSPFQSGAPLESLILSVGTRLLFGVLTGLLFAWSIPVLDENNKILGVITAQDIVQVVDDEMGDDYAKLAGLASEEELNEPIRQSVHKRLPWLIILLGLGLVVSSVVGLFEGVVAQLTIVICFQSLILDMAGNVGTQSLAVTIRVLMDENLDGKQKLGLVFKEARVGMCNGLILGVLSFVFIGLYVIFAKGMTPGFGFAVSACIGVALLLAMMISSVSGTVIPILFKKFGVDPAVASGPLITTVNDLVAVISYYGLTWIFLIEMLHLTD